MYQLHDAVAFRPGKRIHGGVASSFLNGKQKQRPQLGASKRRFVSIGPDITMYYLSEERDRVPKGNWSALKKHPSDVR